jgi:hypothetical protein
MRMGAEAGLGGGAVVDFLGGSPAEFPDRYAVAEPNLTGDAAYAVIEGDADDIVPEQFARPDRPGSSTNEVTFVLIPGADHFDVIDPTHDAWTAAVAELAS